MSKPSCVCSTDVSDSPLRIALVLKGCEAPCGDCGKRTVVEAMVRQFRAKHPRWWIVDGAMGIPIWVLERLRSELNRRG